MQTSRRGFLFGLGAALATPTIVRAESLMRIIRPTPPAGLWVGDPDFWGPGLAGQIVCQQGISIEAMREILMPGLRKAFDEAYVSEKLAEIAVRRHRALERLAARRNDPDRNYLYLDPDKTRARNAWRNPETSDHWAVTRDYPADPWKPERPPPLMDDD